MKRRDSIYQLILSIVYTILGGLCFIPNFNFLQNMIFIIGLLITIIGIVFFIRGIIKDNDDQTRQLLITIGLVISLIGIAFSTLVWVLFAIFTITLGIICIGYGLIGLYVVIKDKYNLPRIRIFSTLKSLFYVAIGVLLIIDCKNSFPIIGHILGILLLINGIIGIISYIIYFKTRKQVIDVTEEELDLDDENKIIIDVDENEE